MAHRIPAPLRALLAVLRALLGLIILAALVGGVPYVLLALGHQPTDLADGIDLLAQDDGSLFLTVLTCIGWTGWAAFTFSVLLEVAALLRRRSAPRIKGLGSLQSLASFLIGGIVLLAPTAASAATPAPVAAAAATHTAGHDPATPAAAPAVSRTAGPTHTVTSATELPWDLAQTYLGDGTRWKDLAALNPNIAQLASGDQYLPKGTVLQLPADARPPAPAAPSRPQTAAAAAPTTTAQQPDSVTVREGDTLWSIADDQGDPQQWKAIYDTNKGQPLPGGGTFDDPDLIYPGQVLDLPHTAPPGEPHRKPGTPETARPKPPSAHHDQQTPAPPTAAPSPKAEASTPAAPSRTPAPAPSTPDGRSAPPQAAPDDQSHDTALAPAAVWAGAGALAAALIGTLATRRLLQQRRRRPGRRIPMPAGRAAATEQGLRAAQHPTGLDLLGTALRSLALHLSAAHRDLPALQAVVLHETKVELHLAEDTPPAKPFTAAPGRQDLWVCPASSPDLADSEQLAAADAPYPALASLGWDDDGHLVLIDLEHAGIVHLAGDATCARQVLQAIAVELASTPLSDHLEITALSDTVPGLEHAVPERVARTRALPDATAELIAHTADQRRTLAAVGADSLRAARLTDDAAGAWTPHILLAADLPDGPDRTALIEALTEEPRTAGAVITAETTSDLPDTAWTLDCQGPEHPVTLPGSHLTIRLQGLSDDHFTDAVDLLTLAASHTDVPAPADTTGPYDLDDEWEGMDEFDDAVDAYAGNVTPGPHPHEHADVPAAAAPPSAAGSAENNPHEDASSHAPTAGLPPTIQPTDRAHTTGVAPTGEAPLPTTPDSGTPGATSPCATPAPPAVHVTIPSPATSTISEPAAEVRPAEAATDTATGPAVLLLGPVTIDGAGGRIDSSRRNAGTELTAFLALNPGADHHAIDDALWPGRLVGKQMRNAVISRTRSWLGKDTVGQAHLPRVQDTGDSRYRLGPHVTCDWTQFQELARTGLTRHDEDGDLALRRALALVRGRPFSGIDPQRYAWAEPAIQEMVSAIVDVAYELATRCRENDDVAGALWAARRGLLAAEESELLHRQLFLAHHAVGDIDALREAAARLARINEQLLGGADLEVETAELLRNLLPRPATRAR
ncbi:LysM peptidoglycan-binding domain-containing protein [Streptomyces sp. NPDC045470]|uniref:LysM peptidoglycan-binding domain-containing protein n=1 Tax=Streptomyces sp. NPDC045470 TaxID=3155469 RepID=UPI0034073812